MRDMRQHFNNDGMDPDWKPAELADMRIGCPCTVPDIEPCRSSCSCANPVMSGGCDRCAKYGSLEQRQGAARRIVAALQSAQSVRSEALEKVLRELVELKDMKDRDVVFDGDRYQEYARRKPLAWAAARAVLQSPARVAEGNAGDLSRYTCESRGEVPAPESPAKEQPGEQNKVVQAHAEEQGNLRPSHPDAAAMEDEKISTKLR